MGDEEQVAVELRRFAEAGVTEFVEFPHGGAETAARAATLLAGMRW